MRLSPPFSFRAEKVTMKAPGSSLVAIFLLTSAAYFMTGEARAQAAPQGLSSSNVITCSPAPFRPHRACFRQPKPPKVDSS
jgi:hypothetical protein